MKKNVAELDHSDLLPVYESSFAKMQINISRKKTEQILVRFSQIYLQTESFQMFATEQSKMANGCCY